MRRFSQRSYLVTLSEINITPLLDLAFVLLIIFVITTPLLTQSIDITLPKGGAPTKRIQPRDVRNVEITRQGSFTLDRRRMDVAQVVQELKRSCLANPNTVVRVCVDEEGFNKYTIDLLDRCVRDGVTRLSFATEPPGIR